MQIDPKYRSQLLEILNIVLIQLEFFKNYNCRTHGGICELILRKLAKAKYDLQTNNYIGKWLLDDFKNKYRPNNIPDKLYWWQFDDLKSRINCIKEVVKDIESNGQPEQINS